MLPPPLILSETPVYTTPFCEDPWPEDDDDEPQYSPASSCKPSSARSSRTSSSASHVLPESAFVGADGRFLVDPYLGKEDIARLCSGYLIKSFHAQEETGTSKRLGQPKLSIFIAQLIYLTNPPYNAVLATLILLQRFRAKLPAETPVGLSGHILWLSAFIIACRDESMQGAVRNAKSAAYWSELTLYSEREVDEMYRELWDELEGNVIVFPSYASALEKLKNPLPPSPTSSFAWPEGEPWIWDDDEDEDDIAHSVSNAVCNSKPTRTKPEPTRSTSSSKVPNFQLKPKSKFSAAMGGSSSPASSALRTRLVSFFKKKA